MSVSNDREGPSGRCTLDEVQSCSGFTLRVVVRAHRGVDFNIDESAVNISLAYLHLIASIPNHLSSRSCKANNPPLPLRQIPKYQASNSPLIQSRDEISLRPFWQKARNAEPARLLVIPGSTVRSNSILQNLGSRARRL